MRKSGRCGRGGGGDDKREKDLMYPADFEDGAAWQEIWAPLEAQRQLG